jgi:hypothetical protein
MWREYNQIPSDKFQQSEVAIGKIKGERMYFFLKSRTNLDQPRIFVLQSSNKQ